MQVKSILPDKYIFIPPGASHYFTSKGLDYFRDKRAIWTLLKAGFLQVSLTLIFGNRDRNKSFSSSLCFVFFFFFGHTYSLQKFPGPGIKPEPQQ